MARKSRKVLQKETQNYIPAAVSTEKKLATAAYARLSVEKEDDDSIHTQITLLKNYISEHSDLELSDTYIDNGFTGTRFDRPDFVRMMDDVRCGKIQCIVVKDLSRFGRDFLETGYYIETLLPRLNVRLISINDDFDSFREGDINSIAIPIKNMVNELYAKDFSRKVTAYNDLHRERGDVKLLRSVYGYKRDAINNIYVVNPDTAPIVQMIFRWYLLDVSTGQIAKRLNTMQILTPLAYKAIVEKGEEFNQEGDAWNNGRVRDILRNTIYIGDLTWGKRRKTLFRNVPEHKTPKEEWVICHNMHEPLISKADFEEVQRRLDAMADKLRSPKEYEYNPPDQFQSKVYCLDCGKKMRYSKYCYGNRDGAFYSCGCRVIGSANEHHNLWKVNADFLKIVVADQVNQLVAWMCDRKKLVARLQAEFQRNTGTLKVQKRKLQLQMKVEQIEDKLTTLYENLAEGIINAEDYKIIKERYLSEKDAVRGELQAADVELRQVEAQLEEFMELVSRLEQYLGQGGFNEALVRELVESIQISQNNGIEIRFVCEDVIQQITEMGEEAAS